MATMDPAGSRRRPPLEDLGTFRPRKPSAGEKDYRKSVAGTVVAAAWPAAQVAIPRAIAGWKTVSLAVLIGAAVAGAVHVHAKHVAARKAAERAAAASAEAGEATNDAPAPGTSPVTPTSSASVGGAVAALRARWHIPDVRLPPIPNAVELPAQASEKRREGLRLDAIALYERAAEWGRPGEAFLGEAVIYQEDFRDPRRALELYRAAADAVLKNRISGPSREWDIVQRARAGAAECARLIESERPQRAAEP
jgi:hypothetical protein